MTELDWWGCPVTAEHAEAELVSETIHEFVTLSPDLASFLPRLADGGPLARSVLALLLAMSHRPALVAQARTLADGLDPDEPGVSERERLLMRSAGAVAHNRLEDARTAWVEVLAAHPTDVLALQLLYLHYFASGHIAEMVDLVPGVRPHWHDEVPLASYLDGKEAFALEEQGRYEEAETLGRQGVEAEPGDLWAIHAVAHVLEMQQRRDEGVAWLDRHHDVLDTGGFAGHLWWHQAIQLWALGDHEAVVRRFDEQVYPGSSTEGLDLSNAISLLARLESNGVEVGDRWDRLADGAVARLGQHTHPFNDTHYALALGRAGRPADGRRLVDGMAAWSTDDGAAGRVLAAVGVEVAEGMLAFGLGDHEAAVDRLTPTTDQWWRLGGSRAQRLFYEIVLDDAVRRSATGSSTG